MFDVDTISRAIDEAKSSQGRVSIQEYEAGSDPSVNEYLLFIKPELTGLGDAFRPVLDLIIERLRAFGQTPAVAAAVGSGYLVRHNIMSQHYGVIDAVSKRGVDAMSEGARQRLEEVIDGAEPHPLLVGAHQFLEQFPYFSAQALAVFYDNLQNIKLAGGTHAVRAVVRGRPVLVFNGFHPEQLERYTQRGATIMLFVFRTDLPWSEIRTNMTGVTNPAKAAPESIRGRLYAERHRLGLEEVSSGKNGVHVSAGPVEGMAEIMRFMSNLDESNLLKPEHTTFGKLLLTSGASSRQLRELAQNAVVQVDGKMIPAFDLTEELDAVSARDRLFEAGVLGGA